MASTRFLGAIVKGHKVGTLVDQYRGGVLHRPNLPVTSGKVDVDGSAAVRRKFNAEFIDKDGSLFPDLRAGDELRPYRGIIYPDGTKELLPLGVFRLSSRDISEAGYSKKGVLLSISSYDRARSIIRNRLTELYVIGAGTNYVTAIRDLIDFVRPGLEYELPATSSQTGLIVLQEGTDAWGQAQKMATAIGCELFFDVLGRVVLRSIASRLLEDPVLFIEGEDSNLLDISFHEDDEPGFNGVKAVGAPPDQPEIVAYRWDDDPMSPTYWKGDYGPVAAFYRSELMVTQAQVDAAADKRFAALTGLTRQVRLTAVVDPSKDAGMLAQVRRKVIGVDGFEVIDTLTIPFDLNADMDVVMYSLRNGAVATESE